MDNEQFESFFNTCVATSNAEKQKAIDEENVRIKKEQDAKQDELDAKEQKLKDEQREVEHQKELKATEERVRAEAEAKAKEDADRKERERIEEEKRIENQKKIDAAKLAKQKEYIDYLKSLGWTKETKEDFKTEETSSGYVIWKKVGEFKK
jgi:Skp family chaperone for outer membrane proteins